MRKRERKKERERETEREKKITWNQIHYFQDLVKRSQTYKEVKTKSRQNKEGWRQQSEMEHKDGARKVGVLGERLPERRLNQVCKEGVQGMKKRKKKKRIERR